ncbi:TetR/AcrR family transcriptional regulator, mexJK operon transcriptional repressor [uncultured Gammaproteobacteria bacterium]
MISSATMNGAGNGAGNEAGAETAECAPASVKVGQILAAAGRLFLEHGYGATSMETVARTAEVSKATLYAHFPSKEKLFAAIVAGECGRLTHVFDDAGIDCLPVEQALTRMGQEFFNLVMSAKGLAVFRMVIAESRRFPELGRAFYDTGPTLTLRRLEAYLDRANRRGDLAITDVVLACEQFMGLLRGHLHTRLLMGLAPPPSELERNRFIVGAVDLFTRGYAPGRVD